jgi:Fusaric acid resistance protein-like
VFQADSLPAALRPTNARWAVRPAIWAVLAAGTVAGAGVITGDQVAAGLAYFGVACAAVLVTSGVYRARLAALISQGAGAAGAIVLGVAVAGSVPAMLAAATAVALASGMVGAIGRLTTAGALMAVIGLGFGEFAHVRMPGWEQGGWYLVGTLAVAVCALAGWPLYRDRAGWIAVATVFDRSADLVQVAGSDDASPARLALAAASAVSRSEVFDHRFFTARFREHGPGRSLTQAAGAAEQAALAAAALYACGQVAPDGVAGEWRRAASDCRQRRVPELAVPLATTFTHQVQPLAARFRAAAQLATGIPAILAGLRLAVCMATATAVTCALHNESHSFWLPLTVAVAVRPEYASVFVRTVNRVAGTAAGALLAAAAIALLGSGWPVAIAAAISLAFAVLAVPKLYGLSVVGVTCSALLSSCIDAADPVNPAIRLLDTLIGCTIAIVLGYLLWPGRRAAPVVLTETGAAIAAYLQQAAIPASERRDWTAVRDRAYQLAHQSRQLAQAALLDPLPVRTYAAELLPRALTLESLVDEVTAIADRSDAVPPQQTAALAERISTASR